MSWCAKVATNGVLSRREMLGSGAAALMTAPVVIRSSSAQPAAINIGVVVPLSGANAQFGVNSRNGIELVADEINCLRYRPIQRPAQGRKGRQH
jgi:branched-chain amino acid transport system substrate-binding protein